jgi:hypothetical protein
LEHRDRLPANAAKQVDLRAERESAPTSKKNGIVRHQLPGDPVEGEQLDADHSPLSRPDLASSCRIQHFHFDS